MTRRSRSCRRSSSTMWRWTGVAPLSPRRARRSDVSLPATTAFNWSISTEGYAWMIGRPDSELDWPGVPAGAPVPFLVDQRVFRGANARPARRYRPLEDTSTLFLDFADTHANFSEI